MTTNPRFPWRRTGAGILCATAGWMTTDIPLPHAGQVGWTELAAGAILATGPSYLYARRRWSSSTKHTLARWTNKTRRTGGVASWWDYQRNASPWAMRRQITTLIPDTADLSWRARRRVPLTRYATPLVRDGRRTIWVPVEYVTGRVGGPRRGKTGELVCRIVDAPGAVVATSTRPDIVQLSAPSREKVGPIHIFNPGGVGSWASTIKWSPLVGCRIPRVAQDRAADMIPRSQTAEGERWDVQARGVLAVLMHAAALRGLPMRAVLAWTSNPDERTTGREVYDALKGSREERAMTLAASQFFTMNDRTKTSITTTIMPALRWLMDSRAANLGDSTEEGMLDVRELIDQKGTVYLLGGEDGLTASLIAALTSEIARQARIQANVSGGRLDPAFTFVLDEAALICPVPLDRWTADMGGRNISIHWCVQSRAQLRQVWGTEASGTIINNTAVLLVFGGTKDPDDLEAWSKLSGDREVETATRDENGNITSYSTRKEPVFSPATIARIPKRHALVLHADMPACIGRATMAWERRDIRRDIAASPFREVLETSYADEALDDPAGVDSSGGWEVTDDVHS